MPDINIGRALSGLGAAFKNEVPAFLQQVRQEDLDAEKRAEREMFLADRSFDRGIAAEDRAMRLSDRDRSMAAAEAKRLADIDEKRQETLFIDSKIALDALKSGGAGLGAVLQKFTDRRELLPTWGVTNLDLTEDIIRLAASAYENPADLLNLKNRLEGYVNTGIAYEVLDKPALPSIVPASAIDEFGNITTRNPSGGGFTTTSTLSEGAEPRISNDSLKNNMDYRKEFNGLQSVKDFANRRGALGIVEASASDPSAAGDLSLIFAYMRMLDPGSVVRESEFQLAASAGSLPTIAQAAFEQVKSGRRLTQIQRDDFTKRAKTIYTRATADFGELYEDYEIRAKRMGLTPLDALVDYRFKSASEINDEGILNNDQGSAVPIEFTVEEWGALTPSEQREARVFLTQSQLDRQDY